MSTFTPSDVIGRALAIYREHAGALIPAAVVVFAVVAVANLVLTGVLSIVASAIGLIATIFYQGMVVRLVDDVRDGTLDSSVEALFKSVAPVALTLFLLSLVVGVSVAIGLILLIVPGLFLLTIWASRRRPSCSRARASSPRSAAAGSWSGATAGTSSA